jgi:copper resistance protein B
MKLPRLLLLLLAAWPAWASAQRLAYENVLDAEHRAGPRLAYESVLDAPLPRPAPAEREEETVRAFYGDRFEWQPQAGGDVFTWDMSGEVGSARHRLWLAMTGDAVRGGGVEYLELHALYSRPLGDSDLALQAGLRRDFVPRPRRTYAVLGVQGGLDDSTYLGAFAFLSNRGEFTGRFYAYSDLSLADRLVLQPTAEMEIAGADVPALEIGAGPVYVEAGLRLRYRLDEAFSPYVGVNWTRLLGRTARMARDEGERADSTNLVVGVRSYF